MLSFFTITITQDDLKKLINVIFRDSVWRVFLKEKKERKFVEGKINERCVRIWVEGWANLTPLIRAPIRV